MVNVGPLQPEETNERTREWMLERLDFMRALVEAGEACAIEDKLYDDGFGREVHRAGFVFWERDWLRTHRARMGQQPPLPRC